MECYRGERTKKVKTVQTVKLAQRETTVWSPPECEIMLSFEDWSCNCVSSRKVLSTWTFLGDIGATPGPLKAEM